MIVISYPFLDASTEEYQEEEEVYPQEEEDHFDQYTNQGKLIFLQGARLYQSKAYSPIILCFMIPSQVFTSFYFGYLKLTFIVNLGLSME